MSRVATTGLWLVTMVSAGAIAAMANPVSLSFWLAEAMLLIGFVVAAVTLASKIGSDSDEADMADEVAAFDMRGLQPIPVRIRRY